MVVPRGNKSDSDSNKGVRYRLLDTAEELFCEHGFEGASIRDIAAAAECNVASVNYYFGGKQQLYEEVWRRHLIPMRDARIESINNVMSQDNSGADLEVLLRSFADTFVSSIVDTGRASRLSKLMAREYINRHLPASMFVDEVMMPTMTAMRKALMQTCPDIDESKILLVVFSIIGQLVHLVHVRAMFEQGGDDLNLPVFDSTEAINHIVKFSAAGIQVYAEGKTK